MEPRLAAYDLGASGVSFRYAAVFHWRHRYGPLDNGATWTYMRLELRCLESAQQSLELGEEVAAGLKQLRSDYNQFLKSARRRAFGVGQCPGEETWEAFLSEVDMSLASRPWLGPWFRLGQSLAGIILASQENDEDWNPSEAIRARAAAQHVIESKELPPRITRVLRKVANPRIKDDISSQKVMRWLRSIRKILDPAFAMTKHGLPQLPPVVSVPRHAFHVVWGIRKLLHDLPLPDQFELVQLEDTWQAIFNGKPYLLEYNHFLILQSLLRAKGTYVTESQILKEHGDLLGTVRLKRQIAKMPNSLRSLISTKNGWHGGIRLDL